MRHWANDTYVIYIGLSEDEATVWMVDDYNKEDDKYFIADLVSMQDNPQPNWGDLSLEDEGNLRLFWLQKGDIFTANGIPYRMKLERLEYDNQKLYAIVSYVGGVTTGGRNTRYPIDASSKKEIQFI